MESDMAAHVFKDPYLFDFLGTADPRREREVEHALVDHIQRFLLELGTGFAFVGRQALLEVGDQDFYADLLFYHLKHSLYDLAGRHPGVVTTVGVVGVPPANDRANTAIHPTRLGISQPRHTR